MKYEPSRDRKDYFTFEDDELFRASLGFESMGNHHLSAALHGILTSYPDTARLAVAGNLALLRSLEAMNNSERIEALREAARMTVESGLAALEEYQTAEDDRRSGAEVFLLGSDE